MSPARDRRLGLRARVMVAFACLGLVLSAGLALFSYELSRRYLIDQREAAAGRQAYLNARAVRAALRSNAADVRGALSSLQTSTDGAAVVRVAGQWFGTSVGVGRDSIPPPLRRLVAAGAAGHQRTMISSVPQVVVGVPLAGVDTVYFEFVPLAELDRTLSALARALIAGAVITTLAGGVLGRYASGRVLRPVRRMADAAGGIGEGALDRLDAEGDSDLEPLVSSFNEMVAALQARIEREARFASDVSHELRGPLAAMGSALSVARRRSLPDAPSEALDVLDSEIQSFTRLVLDLLELSRTESGVAKIQLDPVEVADFVRAVLDSTGRTGVALEVDAEARGGVVLDKRRMGQVLGNLLDNADRYGGGAAGIVVTGTDQALRIAVDDSGPGVAEHERAYVFERFARGEASATPGAAGGTGLGLALVAEHVRLHGGRVWVEEAPGGGARFVVEIPRNEP